MLSDNAAENGAHLPSNNLFSQVLKTPIYLMQYFAWILYEKTQVLILLLYVMFMDVFKSVNVNLEFLYQCISVMQPWISRVTSRSIPIGPSFDRNDWIWLLINFDTTIKAAGRDITIVYTLRIIYMKSLHMKLAFCQTGYFGLKYLVWNSKFKLISNLSSCICVFE